MTDSGWQGLRPFVVQQKQPESETVTSFYLVPEDGGPIPDHKPGQYLGFALDVPGHDRPVNRTYTISEAPGRGYYRCSIKREPAPADRAELPPGVSSNHFHDDVEEGTVLQVRAPMGEFFLEDGPAERPLVLLSGGVGLTPMIAMLDALADRGMPRRVLFVHGVRNGAEHAFADHVRELAEKFDNLSVHVRYSEPRPEDRAGVDYDAGGLFDAAAVLDLAGTADVDVYLCGPDGFMRALYGGLRDAGVVAERIRYEFFGAGTPLENEVAATPGPAAAAAPAAEPAATAETAPTAEEGGDGIQVTFRASGITVAWDPAAGTLLDLAEEEGIPHPSSCRQGFCHTCICDLVEGEIEYLEENPVDDPGDGAVLLCSARPLTDVVVDA